MRAPSAPARRIAVLPEAGGVANAPARGAAGILSVSGGCVQGQVEAAGRVRHHPIGGAGREGCIGRRREEHRARREGMRRHRQVVELRTRSAGVRPQLRLDGVALGRGRVALYVQFDASQPVAPGFAPRGETRGPDDVVGPETIGVRRLPGVADQHGGGRCRYPVAVGALGVYCAVVVGPHSEAVVLPPGEAGNYVEDSVGGRG